MKGLLALSALLIALGASADEFPLEKHMLVACAATNTLLVTQLEEGPYQDAIADEAKRFTALAQDISLIQQLLGSMQLKVTNGDMTRDEIVAMSQRCSATYGTTVADL